jgi:hypothetical protein
MLRISAAVVMTLWTCGCVLPQRFPHYISDSTIVVFDEVNGITPTQGHQAKVPRIVFSNIGDRYRVRIGEPVEIVYSNVDVANSMLIASSVTGSDYLELTLQRQTQPIVLSSKCQTVEIRGIDRVPSLTILDNEKNLQQVIVTPIISPDCSTLLGYEIRYGSIQQGCSRTSNLVERLSRCREGNATAPIDTRRVESLKKLWFNVGR